MRIPKPSTISTQSNTVFTLQAEIRNRHVIMGFLCTCLYEWLDATEFLCRVRAVMSGFTRRLNVRCDGVCGSCGAFCCCLWCMFSDFCWVLNRGLSCLLCFFLIFWGPQQRVVFKQWRKAARKGGNVMTRQLRVVFFVPLCYALACECVYVCTYHTNSGC